jgi:ArsR family transcriptional regulator
MLAEKVDAVAALLKSISHPTRLMILCLLQDGELSVSEIRETLQTTDANISQHLNILRNQGVVKSRKDSNFIYNRIADQRVIKLIDTLQGLYC